MSGELPASFGHFSNSETWYGLNEAPDPFAGSMTPRAIYAYDLRGTGRYTYAADRSYVHLLEPVGEVLDAKRYSAADLERDIDRLRELHGADVVDQILEKHAKYQREAPRQYTEVPAGILYYVLGKLAPVDPDEGPGWNSWPGVRDPRLISQRFRELGYCGFNDRFGIIYSSEPEQAAFFGDDCVRHVGVAPSPFRRNPMYERVDAGQVVVGTKLELERQSIHEHPGYVPAGRTTVKTVARVKRYEDGDLCISFVGMKIPKTNVLRSFRGQVQDGELVRVWSATKPPLAYAVLRVVGSKREPEQNPTAHLTEAQLEDVWDRFEIDYYSEGPAGPEGDPDNTSAFRVSATRPDEILIERWDDITWMNDELPPDQNCFPECILKVSVTVSIDQLTERKIQDHLDDPDGLAVRAWYSTKGWEEESIIREIRDAAAGYLFYYGGEEERVESLGD